MNNPTILSKARISRPSVYERMYHLEEGPSTEPESSSCYLCSRSRSSVTGVHRFPKIWEPPDICTPQQGDMQLSPHRGNTNIRCHGTKCIRPGDLEPRICAPLFQDMKLHQRVTRRRRFETSTIPVTPSSAFRRFKMIILRYVETSGFVYPLIQRHTQKHGILSYTALNTFRTVTEARHNISVVLSASRHVPRAILQPYSTAE
jgi:hypothetical protein